MTYTWDANKSKISESITGVMSGYGFTAGGQTVATDVKGNITTLPANLRPAGDTTAMNLTWDSDTKRRSAAIDANGTAEVNFQYDALVRRVARSGTGGSVVFVQMDQHTIADYPVGGAATTPTFRYVYASYIDEPVVRKGPTSTSTVHFYHRNHQYSITAVTTSTGTIAERYAYSAYGQPTILDASGSVLSTSSISHRYTYTGREWDATLGLHHFRARWMSPSAGRFLGRDPIGYFDGMGLYSAYFASSGFDPFGLYEQPDTDLANCKIWSTNTRKKIDNIFPVKRIAPWATIRGSLFWEVTFRNRLCDKKCDCSRSAPYESNEVDLNVNGRFSLTLGIDEDFSGKGPLKKLKFKAWGGVRGDLDIMGRGSGQLYKDGCSGKEGGQVCIGVEVRTAVRGGVEAKVSYDNWEWDLATAELIFQCQNIRIRKCWDSESDIENPNFGDVKGISCNLLIRFCAYGYCYNEQLW